jgi:predicted RNA-binding protein with PUA-like domain
MLDVKYIRHTKRNITLSELREHKEIEDMRLLQKGNRLSVIPMTKSEWDYILGLE